MADIIEFMGDLEGGVFIEKLQAALYKVATGVVAHDKQGAIDVSLTLKRIGNSYQVEVKHKLTYKCPTAKGESSEKEATTTPMHVGKGGALSLFPENQGQLFSKDGKPSN